MIKIAAIILKVIGITALAWHFSHNEVSISLLGVLLYIVILISVAVAFGVISKVYARITATDYHSVLRTSKKSGESYFRDKKKLILTLLLIPGEDGIFLLPLLYLPHSFLIFALFSIAFGFAHFRTSSSLGCILKSMSSYLTIVFILLPFGLESCVLGHLLMDFIAICVHQLTIPKV